MIIRGSSSDECLDLYFLKDLPCFDGDGLYDFLCHEHSLSAVSGMISNYLLSSCFIQLASTYRVSEKIASVCIAAVEELYHQLSYSLQIA